jgi:hypothetical protein
MNHVHPNLRHDGIGAGAEEAFDLEILFDPLKEEFDLPTLPINLG